MKRLAFEKTFGCLLFGVVSLIFTAADVHGQYYDGQSSQQSGVNKLPLNQLPPIVSSGQATAAGKTKGLFIPSNVGSLPPIVSPPQYKAPFVYGQSNKTVRPPTPSFSPPQTSTPSLGQQSGLPPIVQGNPLQKRQSTLQQAFPQSSITRPSTLPTRSQAGVQIYPNAQPSTQSQAPPSPRYNPLQPSKTPAFGVSGTQGSGSRNAAPLIQGPSNVTSPFSSPITNQVNPIPSSPEFSSSLSPVDLPTVPDIEFDNSGGSGSRSFDGSGSRSFDGSGSRNFGSAVSAPPAARGFPQSSPGTNNFFQQTNSGPTSSPASGVNTGCSSCGPGGCYDPAQVQSQNGCCGSVVNAGYYLFADALFWTRGDGDVQLSNSFGLSDFNFVGGYRFTLGFRENATQGTELTIFGTGELDESETATSAAGTLNALFTPMDAIAAGGFFNATSQTQEKSSQLFSAEYNRINWGWDVLKTFVGVRYIYFDDSFSLFSSDGTAAGNGFLTQDSVNNLFGIHGGGELFYDVGFRTSASLTAKFGGYVNAANVDTNVFNAGAQVLNQETDDGAIASTIEIGAMSHFQLSPQSRFRLGYDIFLLWGAFTVENNIPRDTFASSFQTSFATLDSSTGTNLNTSNEPVFLHGLSFGFEIFR